MNLLNNVFECFDSHDYKLLTTYLLEIIEKFIIKNKGLKSEIFINEINIFTTSNKLKIDKDLSFFDVVYESFDKTIITETNKNNLETQHSLLKGNQKGDIIERSLSPLFKFEDIKEEWINNILKIFTLLDSKAIKKLLYMYESPIKSIRKLTMILIQILLFKTDNKIHFIEKCALGFTEGVYVISRIKTLVLITKQYLPIFTLLNDIKKFIQNIISKNKIQNHKIDGILFIKIRFLLVLSIN